MRIKSEVLLREGGGGEVRAVGIREKRLSGPEKTEAQEQRFTRSGWGVGMPLRKKDP